MRLVEISDLVNIKSKLFIDDTYPKKRLIEKLNSYGIKDAPTVYTFESYADFYDYLFVQGKDFNIGSKILINYTPYITHSNPNIIRRTDVTFEYVLLMTAISKKEIDKTNVIVYFQDHPYYTCNVSEPPNGFQLYNIRNGRDIIQYDELNYNYKPDLYGESIEDYLGIDSTTAIKTTFIDNTLDKLLVEWFSQETETIQREIL